MMTLVREMREKGRYASAVLMVCALLILLPAADGNSGNNEKSVKINKEFQIPLDSNPTTGYRWEASFDKAFLKLKADRFKRPTKALIGAGGTQTFVFIPIKEGETEIRLAYKRPWEKSIAREKTVRIHITR